MLWRIVSVIIIELSDSWKWWISIQVWVRTSNYFEPIIWTTSVIISISLLLTYQDKYFQFKKYRENYYTTRLLRLPSTSSTPYFNCPTIILSMITILIDQVSAIIASATVIITVFWDAIFQSLISKKLWEICKNSKETQTFLKLVLLVVTSCSMSFIIHNFSARVIFRNSLMVRNKSLKTI